MIFPLYCSRTFKFFGMEGRSFCPHRRVFLDNFLTVLKVGKTKRYPNMHTSSLEKVPQYGKNLTLQNREANSQNKHRSENVALLRHWHPHTPLCMSCLLLSVVWWTLTLPLGEFLSNLGGNPQMIFGIFWQLEPWRLHVFASVGWKPTPAFFD